MGMKLGRVGLGVLLLALGAGAAGDQFAVWRGAIRRELYVPERLPPLEAKVWSSLRPMAGVVADRVTYRTADGMLVPAVVYRPEHPLGKLPGIVIVNGHGGDKFTWYAVYSGMMFAQAGAEVVTYDPIGEGERNGERRSHAGSHDKIQEAPEGVDAEAFQEDWGRRLAGLMQVDAMQAVRYLQARPEVDAGRVAVVGYSMGAFVSGITGAIWSPRDGPAIRAVLLSGGGTYDDEADGGKSFDVGRLPCQAPPWRSLRVLGSARHMRGAVVYALNAERGAMLVENGAEDEVMDIPHRGPEWFAGVRAQAVALDKANGGTAARMFTTHVDAGMGHRTAWVERPGVSWLNEQLHFAKWGAAEIAAMPVTRVNDWVKVTGADMSKNYEREDREGGLMALGVGIPGVKREELMVLPEGDWGRLKGELVYEGWAERMMRVERAAGVTQK